MIVVVGCGPSSLVATVTVAGALTRVQPAGAVTVTVQVPVVRVGEVQVPSAAEVVVTVVVPLVSESRAPGTGVPVVSVTVPVAVTGTGARTVRSRVTSPPVEVDRPRGRPDQDRARRARRS